MSVIASKERVETKPKGKTVAENETPKKTTKSRKNG